MTEREAAWSLILDRLPDRWRVTPPSYDPATRMWSVTALGPTGGRRKVWKPPAYVEGFGADELEALQDLGRKRGELGN